MKLIKTSRGIVLLSVRIAEDEMRTIDLHSISGFDHLALYDSWTTLLPDLRLRRTIKGELQLRHPDWSGSYWVICENGLKNP